jgi:hypothetical protein
MTSDQPRTRSGAFDFKVRGEAVILPLEEIEPPASPDGFIDDPLQLTSEQMKALLADLDRRLKEQGVAGDIYVVGGAAMVLLYGRDSLTADVDARASHQRVFEMARVMGPEYGLPSGWLNGAAGSWIPTRPESASAPRDEPGLTVHIAPAAHVLAMKIVAMRDDVDIEDAVRLVKVLRMEDAEAKDYADLLYEVYPEEGRLNQMLGVPRADEAATRQEAVYRGAAIVRAVHLIG